MQLTEAEKELILTHRHQQSREANNRKFALDAIATAHQFSVWSAKTGENLTFSTFINTFGYQEPDGKKMYEIVKRVLELVESAAC
ncbi:hypothetical protein FXF61_00400 [Pseudomonas sp. C27(2019)]|uniref:hypothetical protein n=1 Tax=Pseudomonas sp. C27(2019) TaxID=2604941 RepID=UPI0012455753|nr:hypothetical protein [Pseudomonas sp. C27(2019)]QEY57731.1 hypothetical protein FXF61_00400 [Pseudomonas sp. C27(2019)]